MTRAPEGGWYYEQIALGYNYRMTDVQAALGLSQLSRVDEYVARRHEQAARYDSLLAPLPLVTPWQHPDSYSGRHLYVIRLKPGAGGKTHRQVFAELHEAGVGVNLHYIPVYRQPYYEKMGFAAGLCPEAEKYYQEAITLPLFPTMTDEQQDQVVATLARALRA
jgi:dTDP-4-amino-4,6-dideoxygalactose transaminase